MSSSAVPILPIEKGALTKLWAGVALAVIVSGGLAWAGTSKFVGSDCGGVDFPGSAAVETTSTGLKFQTVKAGKGGNPTDADVVLISYKGSLTDGKEFDSGQRVPLMVQGVVPGFSEALKKMQRGGSYKICIPSRLGYGEQGGGPIPPNSTLVFDVELVEFMSMAQMQALQQMQQQQQGAPGGGNPAGK